VAFLFLDAPLYQALPRKKIILLTEEARRVRKIIKNPIKSLNIGQKTQKMREIRPNNGFSSK